MAPQLILFTALMVLLLWLERIRPLRKATQPKVRRVIRNLLIAALSGAVVRIVSPFFVSPTGSIAGASSGGLLNHLALPAVAKTVVSILILDYTLYFWHLLNHKVPFLWRFHRVHHVDLDLDVSTASRFHFGELTLSLGFNALQMFVLGMDPATLVFFHSAVTVSALFHHSNIRLPLAWETHLHRVMVTPRMHGIHHSIVPGETNSNFSTIFNFWDRIHHSMKWGIPQERIVIGVATLRDPAELTLFKSLLLPFRRQQPL